MTDFSINLTKLSKIDNTIYELYQTAITRINYTIINNYIAKIPTYEYLYYEELINNISLDDLSDTYTIMIFLCQKYIMYNNKLYNLPFNLAYPTWLLAEKLDMPFGLSYYTAILSNYKLEIPLSNTNKDILDEVYTIFNIQPKYLINNYNDDDDMHIRSCVMIEYLGYKIYTYLLVLNTMNERELFDFCYLLLNTLDKMDYHSYKPYKNQIIETEINIENKNITFPEYKFNCNNKNQSVYIQVIAYILGIDIKQPYFEATHNYMPKHHKNIINNIHRYPILETKLSQIINHNMYKKINYLYRKCIEEFQYFGKKYINNIDFDNIISRKISLISRKNKQSRDIISSNNIINKYCVSCLLLCIFIYWISYYWF